MMATNNGRDGHNYDGHKHVFWPWICHEFGDFLKVRSRFHVFTAAAVMVQARWDRVKGNKMNRVSGF